LDTNVLDLFVEMTEDYGLSDELKGTSDAREANPLEHKVPLAATTPRVKTVEVLGLRPADARHLADAVGLGCDVFLTNDGGILGRHERIRGTLGLP
jgi:hypothetical protein